MPHKAIWVNGDATQQIRTVTGGYQPSEGELLLRTICVGVNPGDYKSVFSIYFVGELQMRRSLLMFFSGSDTLSYLVP